MVVYYIQVGQNIKAFPTVCISKLSYRYLTLMHVIQGFRMITGNPMLRSYDKNIDDSRSIMFRCLTASDSSGTGQDTNGMPTSACAGGVRSQVNFPT